MTILREQAIGMLHQVPEHQIARVIRFLQNLKSENTTNTHLTRSQTAYSNLQKYRKSQNQDLNYKEELATALEEKYESLN